MTELSPDSLVLYDDDVCDYTADSSDINVVEEESTWSQASIRYLLEECLKRKNELHNPRHRRNKFFGSISEAMRARGFVFSGKMLEKKFLNLKKHFATICQNKDRGLLSPNKTITWKYYNEMMQIFAEDMDIDDVPTMASLYPDPPPSKNAVTVEPQAVRKYNPDCQSDDEEITYISDGANSEEESQWIHKTVVTFLDECIKKKYDLWDPHIRRRTIFSEIRQRLKAKGYNFHQESLDRKLRNLKTHYQVVTESAKKAIRCGSKPRQISWPYFGQLNEIYGRRMEKEIAHKKRGRVRITTVPPVRESQPKTTSKFCPIAPKTGEHANVGPIAAQRRQSDRITVVVPKKLPPADSVCDNSKQFQSTSPEEENPLTNPFTGEFTSYEEENTLSNPFTGEYALPLASPLNIEICQPSPGDFDSSIVSIHSQNDEPHTSHCQDDADSNTSPWPSYEDNSQEQQIDFEVKQHTADKPTSYVGNRLNFSLDILALEERRTIVVEKMVNELIESNRLRQKRLEFNRIKFQYMLARAKRKKNGSI